MGVELPFCVGEKVFHSIVLFSSGFCLQMRTLFQISDAVADSKATLRQPDWARDASSRNVGSNHQGDVAPRAEGGGDISLSEMHHLLLDRGFNSEEEEEDVPMS